LPLELCGLRERAALGREQQLVVGDAAPEKEREPRRELDVVDALHGARRGAGRILLHAE
jgi:hypothetical protein